MMQRCAKALPQIRAALTVTTTIAPKLLTLINEGHASGFPGRSRCARRSPTARRTREGGVLSALCQRSSRIVADGRRRSHASQATTSCPIVDATICGLSRSLSFCLGLVAVLFVRGLDGREGRELEPWAVPLAAMRESRAQSSKNATGNTSAYLARMVQSSLLPIAPLTARKRDESPHGGRIVSQMFMTAMEWAPGGGQRSRPLI